MVKVKFGISDDEPDDLQGSFEPYDGPVPPPGVYQAKLKHVKIKENKNGEDMLYLLFEIAEDRAEKKKFNGYAIHHNANLTEKGKPYVKQMLSALGVTWADFMEKTQAESEDRPTKVTRLGRLKVDSEPKVRINGKTGFWNGDKKLEVQTFLKPLDSSSDDEDEDDDESGSTSAAKKSVKASADPF